MTLIKSISGIRGTIGGEPGDNLTPLDIVKFTAAFGTWIKKRNNTKTKIVVGRDARISGPMAAKLVTGTLMGLGIDVVDIELATTPTVEMAVPLENAQGGIILTASHNPAQWNALKLLNEKGEFISADDGAELLEIAENNDYSFEEVNTLGKENGKSNYNKIHIEKILDLKLVDINAISKKDFTVVIDCVNSVGGVIIPELLESLGVKKIICLYCDPNGEFPHNPEPLPANLTDISKAVVKNKADLGFVVDPDVDRLAIVNEDGSMFGEEYTLVAIADYVLSNKTGNTVSNLSSTRALRDITELHGSNYTAAAVGEVNVVNQMKSTGAVIGGEGNGGVIYPDLHYGRDALVGIAMFLTHLAKSNKTCSQLRASYPNYVISKNKVELSEQKLIDKVLNNIKEEFKAYPINLIDGVKIEFENEWVHLRKSNTEPIIRIYAESSNEEKANKLAEDIIIKIKTLI